jgi:hypothetical protein
VFPEKFIISTGFTSDYSYSASSMQKIKIIKKHDAIDAKSAITNTMCLINKVVKKILNNQLFIKMMQLDATRCKLMQNLPQLLIDS